tara:strand:- start:850 stop:1455 length:606 start_codon:yes stop_codon:yes gene_type:complete
MEIKLNSSNLASYIKIYDDVLDKKILENFKRICREHLVFEDAGVVTLKDKTTSNEVIKETRNAELCTLRNINEESFTNIHWCNFIMHTIQTKLFNYISQVSKQQLPFQIETIQVLKYGIGGHYKFHVDHGIGVPRTFSIIYFVNDDYDGGELIFRNPQDNTEMKIDKLSNRMVIWPSNFLYPHSVKPVTKGIRYSVVSWAL